MIKFDPFRGFEGVQRKMQHFINEFDKGITLETGLFNPRVDILEDDANLYINIEIPDSSKEELNISVSDDRIFSIKGEKKRKNSIEDRTMVRNERLFGAFSRSFSLPENTDIEKISAKYENGVLEVVIPKKEPEKPKEYEVSIL